MGDNPNLATVLHFHKGFPQAVTSFVEYFYMSRIQIFDVPCLRWEEQGDRKVELFLFMKCDSVLVEPTSFAYYGGAVCTSYDG
jgi:hypothetical protein